MKSSPRLTQYLLLAGFVAAAATASHAATAQRFAESEVRRVRLNSERLLKMNPVQGRRVAAVIKDLEGHGLRPLIDARVWRSAEEQARLVAAGNSKIYYSFHTVSRVDPKTKRVLPDSLAADVVDYEKGWSAPRVFCLKLNSSAQSHSSDTGIWWTLSKANRQRLALAIATKEWNYPGPIGWDEFHVEPKGLTPSQAKKGLRPK